MHWSKEDILSNEINHQLLICSLSETLIYTGLVSSELVRESEVAQG